VVIDALCRERHFADHLIPTWNALPKRLRGTFYVHPNMLERVEAAGVEAVDVKQASAGGPLTLVASYRDLKCARSLGRLVIYSEHGAGQSYMQSNGAPIGSGSYIGAFDRAGVVGTLVPGRLAADRHSAVHPTIPAFPIGCPKLDVHHSAMRPVRKKPVVAISFHWHCTVCAETRGAFRHYRAILPKLAQRFDLIGHGHPRALAQMQRYYQRAGIEVVEDFEKVIERADVYAIDNSSTMYEWASLDRPVVVLNAPWFRRKVEHGLRFWSHADVGPQVSAPSALPEGIELAIADPPEIAARRREIVRDVYAAVDGKAAQRAAAVVRDLAKEWG
jgi:hypothetical protein